MRRALIAVSTATVLGLGTIGAGQDSADRAAITPAQVRPSSGTPPVIVEGSSRRTRAPGKTSSGTTINRPGVIPQAPSHINGRPTPVQPPTMADVARAEAALAEAYRYKGTKVRPGPGLNASDARVQTVCAMLSKADFVPDVRVRQFSGLDPRFIVEGWGLTILKVEVRATDSLVRVRVAPLLSAPGEGTIGIMTSYAEDYRIVGGKLQFVGAPILARPPETMISGQ